MNDERLRDLYTHALATRGRDAQRAGCASPEAMLALVRREGSEEERLETLDHVMACAECRRELDLLRAIEAAGTQVEGARPADEPIALWSRGRRTVPWRRVVPLALAASLLLAVGVGVRDRIGAPAGGDAVDVTRGESGALALLAPAPAAYVGAGAPVTFAWRPEPGARRYLLEVLDAQGNVVLSESTADTTLVVRDVAHRLAPGTEYRWWVRLAAGGDPQRASAVRRLRVRSE